MTVKDIRQLALSIGGISGVHAMKKEELIAAIKEIRGITDEPVQKVSAGLIRTLKTKIGSLKAQKEQAHEAGDTKKIKILRKRISRLKKKTRRTASA